MRDPILAPLRERRRKAKNNADRLTKMASRARRNAARAHQRILAVRARRAPERMMEPVALDGTPIPRGLALVLLDARRNGWKGVLHSADRRAGVAERFGKMSQKKLYECSLNCRPDCYGNCNPANPPGLSSHELKGDGIVGKTGTNLPWWQMGMDTSDADNLRNVLNRLGYDAYRPYSHPREQHHTNLRTNPKRRLIERGVI